MILSGTAQAERIGTVVSADGELLELLREPSIEASSDVTIRGPHHTIRVPEYALRDLGHGDETMGLHKLVDLLERSDLTDAQQPFYAYFA